MELPYQKENCKYILETYKSLFENAEEAWQIATSIVKEKDVIGIGNEEYINLAIAGVFAKQIRLFISIFILCERGLASETQILLRAMYESFLNLKFITNSSDKNIQCRNLLLWGRACQSKQLEILKESDPKYEKISADLKYELESFKKELGEENWKIFVRYGPSMKNVAELSKDLGEKINYDYLYRSSSASIHPADLHYFVSPKEEGIQINISPNDNWLDAVVTVSTGILAESLKCVNTLLKLNKDAEINKLNDIIKKMIENGENLEDKAGRVD